VKYAKRTPLHGNLPVDRSKSSNDLLALTANIRSKS